MKTFEQFRAWMKDHQAWNEYLTEFYKFNTKGTPKEIYDQHENKVLDFSFPWWETVSGFKYWYELNENWKKFYSMKYYKLVCTDENVACVKLPENATIAQIGFAKSALQKECQEITVFEREGDFLYGFKKKMELKKV